MGDRRAVGGVDLAGVVAVATQPPQAVVGEMGNQILQSRVRAEEVLANVRAGLDAVLLELAVDGGVHLGDQRAAGVACEQGVPLATPDDLDDVPARTSVQRFELLNDLAVTAHRAVEALQIAVDDEDEVVEPLPSRERQTGQALGLVHLAIADEAPDLRGAGIDDATIMEVSVERWLTLFHETLELGWSGPNARRAGDLADNVARVHSHQLIGHEITLGSHAPV